MLEGPVLIRYRLTRQDVADVTRVTGVLGWGEAGSGKQVAGAR